MVKTVCAIDIYALGKIKADSAFVLWQLQTDNSYSNESAASDIENIVREIIEFEFNLNEKFLFESKNNELTPAPFLPPR
ncbi:hypothetical protein BSK66_22280 [Paenibacillus odorifer]|uniref:Uncharacterized protein n=1 Tax=Paenibacillus odorifer TaxID=189426 RepID=A0A1R0WX75_9BACL|nr:hypothetical protein [Paenibacillus odorifer]OMD23340.1 hypothetical protein BJP51_30440 [Paenibacillus odorifer]OME51964.1 hypothetical protein BSK66_22280 [Paenibacillus odorifer]